MTTTHITILSLACLVIFAVDIPGGYTPERPATPQVEHLVSTVKGSFERDNGPVDQFQPVSYRSQVVAGTNYLVKVRTGDGVFAHLKIFEPLPYTQQPAELKKAQLDKTARDPLRAF